MSMRLVLKAEVADHCANVCKELADSEMVARKQGPNL